MIDATEFYDPALPWSGRADELRSKRAGAALVSELGRNYDAYHEELAETAASLGRPQPENYTTLQEYLEAWARIQAVVRAENLLRVARIVASGGRPPQPADSPPLVSADERLLHLDEALELQVHGGTETSP